MRMHRVWRVIGYAVVALTGVGTLAACSDEPRPIVTHTPSATPTVSAEPSATPSPSPSALSNEDLLALMPPLAAEPDVHGAIATAEFFVGLYAEVFSNHEYDVWEKLSLTDCTQCADIVSDARRYEEEGTEVQGGASHVISAEVRANLVSDGRALVSFPIHQDDIEYRYASGDVQVSEGGESVLGFDMRYDGSIWRVAAIEVHDPDDL